MEHKETLKLDPSLLPGWCWQEQQAHKSKTIFQPPAFWAPFSAPFWTAGNKEIELQSYSFTVIKQSIEEFVMGGKMIAYTPHLSTLHHPSPRGRGGEKSYLEFEQQR